ncbi:MAG TPA: PKD domain-containing protein [Phycisphaerae bacterium]|nr:PKD domain-containing protein [Phycisphaerae bacterium]
MRAVKAVCTAGPAAVAIGVGLGFWPHRDARALDRPEKVFQVFQFPADKIPRVDGDPSDWDIVPDSYAVTTGELVDDSGKHDKPDPRTLDVKVKFGWVKGEHRLYVLYEATDDYWDFSQTGLHNDTFELVVDGDRSGGPLIAEQHPDAYDSEDTQFMTFQGVQAQNYHIFTPAVDKDWCMFWGPQGKWIKRMPWSNAAYKYDFKAGESGKLFLEFWITPFDYASPEGPEKSVPTQLAENKIIGLSFAVIDYDGVNKRDNNGFWNLSRHHTMYGNADELCAFKLMPLDPSLQKSVDADWSWKLVDADRRLVAFHDDTTTKSGKITAWKWDFGDGSTSTEQNPEHAYTRAGKYVVVLDVDTPDGHGRRSKVWDVSLK